MKNLNIVILLINIIYKYAPNPITSLNEILEFGARHMREKSRCNINLAAALLNFNLKSY